MGGSILRGRLTGAAMYRVLKKHPIFHPNGMLKPRTRYREVWKKAVKELQNLSGHALSIDSIYFHVRGDVRFIKSKLVRNLKVEDRQVERISESENSDLSDFSDNQELLSNCSDDDRQDVPYEDDTKIPNPHNFEKKIFSIYLNADLWRLIKPISKDTRLKPYVWTPIVSRLINDVGEIYCAFSFKFSKVYSTVPYKYFDFQGMCKECGTHIYGLCPKEPENDNEVEINIHTYDTSLIKHDKKRHVINLQRKEVKKKLLYTTASRHRNEMADEMMNFSQCEPPDLSNTDVLRKIKEEAVNEYLNYNLPIKDPVKALFALAKLRPFIKKVCAFPFRVIYWFDEQIGLWNQLAKFNPVISIDATGSVVKSVITEGLKNSHVMVYQIIAEFNNTYAPIFQMASARQDTNIIRSFVNDWKKLIEVPPKEITTDMSLALLNGVCLSFNECTYKIYLTTCLQYLQNDGQDELPFQCYLRLDRAHLINAVARWKILTNLKDDAVRDFYKRIFGYAIQIKDFVELETVIFSTFVICQSEFFNDDSASDILHKNLMANLRHSFTEDKNESDKRNAGIGNTHSTKKDNEEMVNENCYPEDIDCESMVTYLKKLWEHAKTFVDVPNFTSRKNTLHLPQIEKHLISTFAHFPAFSNVMQRAFHSKRDIASSALSEAYNKDIKGHLGLGHPLSAHKFILFHGKIISGQTKIAKGKIKNYQKLSVENLNLLNHGNGRKKQASFDNNCIASIIKRRTKKDFNENSKYVLTEDISVVERNGYPQQELINNQIEEDVGNSNYMCTEDISVVETNEYPQQELINNHIEEDVGNSNYMCTEDISVVEINEYPQQELINNHVEEDVENSNYMCTEDMSVVETNEYPQQELIVNHMEEDINQNLFQEFGWRNNVKEMVNKHSSEVTVGLGISSSNIKSSSKSASKLGLVLNNKNNAIETFGIPIFNGLRLKEPVLHDGKRYLKYIKTCPFDSIFEVLLFLNNVNEIFETFLDEIRVNKDNKFAGLLQKYALKEISTTDVYVHRAIIMDPFVSAKFRNGNTVDCSCNVAILFDKLIEDNYLLKRKYSCQGSNCGFKTYSHSNYVTIVEKYPKNNPLLSSSIKFSLQQFFKSNELENCRRCEMNTVVSELIQINGALIIDVEDFYLNVIRDVESVPKEIIWKQKVFFLKGLILSEGETGLGRHYYALCHIKSKNKWEKRDGMSPVIDYLSNIPNCNPLCLMFYVTNQ